MHTLKEVSKAKHWILEKYFPAWAIILGQYHRLIYVDCFAGAGKYANDEPGSPLIILNLAEKLISTTKIKGITLIFIEKNKKKADELKRNLDSAYNGDSKIRLSVYHEDAKGFVELLFSEIAKSAPAFYFIDPYGHPVSLPVIKRILQSDMKEVFLNLMWFSINQHLDNPKEREPLNKMFGHKEWQLQEFMSKKGDERQKLFLDYVFKQIGAAFPTLFRIIFSPEDQANQGRTKYYLIHFSNHHRAAFIMKDIMHKLGDEEGTFEYSASRDRILFSKKPPLSDLREFLIKKYSGKGIKRKFVDLLIDTHDLPFVIKEYRKVLKEMEGIEIEIKRIKSKKTGIAEEDIIIFR